jgi:DNA-binding NarL/FixJ family response regulator
VEKINVLLASTHTGLCQSLQQVLELEQWMNVVVTSESETGVLMLAKTMIPEVIILDLDLTDSNPDISRQIFEMSPEAKIIVLGLHDHSGRVIVESKNDNGTLSYNSVEWLSKNSSPAELIKSISKSRKKRTLN